jgi:hypothetical protein
MIALEPAKERHHGCWGLAAKPWLRRYEAAFRDNAINEKVLPSLTAEDLKELVPTIADE